MWYKPALVESAECNLASAMEHRYQHPASKVVCVGRNYVAHAKELNNPVPKEPLLFIKPNSSLQDFSQAIVLADEKINCHHELEIAILIGEPLSNAKVKDVEQAVVGVGLALDLTLRDVQQSLKDKGQPWEKAKAFDGACPISHFVQWQPELTLDSIEFELKVNGLCRQKGNSKEMIFPILPLIASISTHFSLLPGDIILTGTPEGVGPLAPADKLAVYLNDTLFAETEVRLRHND